jgi:GT2 family glycosyltransferase
MKVSLIVPTFGREQLLVQTLACALRQDLTDHEVIVVDQTARHEPETEEFLRRHADRIRILRLETPSVTKARNAGIRSASGDIMVFVDDDTTFEPAFLSRHLDAHREGSDVVAGRILEENCRVASKPTWISDALRYSGGDTCTTPGRTNTITGCNFSISRKTVETIGYFDERFQGVSTREDSDYGLRAHRAGLTIRFAPDACLFHHRSASGGVTGVIRNQFFDPSYYQCELLFARKHFSPRTIFVYRIRLLLRGLKQLSKLIRQADRRAAESLASR